MKLNWNSKLSLHISEHINELLCSEEDTYLNVAVARLTDALPVYSDLTGILCIKSDGSIIYFNTESEQVKPIIETGYIILAAVSAALKYNDLQEMLPTRPPTAKPCPVCLGTGQICLGTGQTQGKVFCGKCIGLGWIE